MTNTTKIRNARNHYTQYLNSRLYSLDHCYGRYSGRKASAWEYCRDQEMLFSGWNLKVITYNTNIFTAGFTYDDPVTGRRMFRYITPTYDISCEI